MIHGTQGVLGLLSRAYLLTLGSLILIGGPLGHVAGGAPDIHGFRMALVAVAALLALGGAIGEVSAVGPDPLRGPWPVGRPHRVRP